MLIGDQIDLQEKLLKPEYAHQKLDITFMQSFAKVVLNRWPSLASLLCFTAREIDDFKQETRRYSCQNQALHLLKKWNSCEDATYGNLYNRLKIVPLFLH